MMFIFVLDPSIHLPPLPSDASTKEWTPLENLEEPNILCWYIRGTVHIAWQDVGIASSCHIVSAPAGPAQQRDPIQASYTSAFLRLESFGMHANAKREVNMRLQAGPAGKNLLLHYPLHFPLSMVQSANNRLRAWIPIHVPVLTWTTLFSLTQYSNPVFHTR